MRQYSSQPASARVSITAQKPFLCYSISEDPVYSYAFRSQAGDLTVRIFIDDVVQGESKLSQVRP